MRACILGLIRGEDDILTSLETIAIKLQRRRRHISDFLRRANDNKLHSVLSHTLLLPWTF